MMDGEKMNNQIEKWILFLAYCIPYPFLAMYGDVTYGAIGCLLFYGLFIICTGGLCWLSIKTKNIPIGMIGSLLSGVISYGCVVLFQTEIWKWYFKPFRATTLVIILSVVAFLIQLIIWKNAKSKEK